MNDGCWCGSFSCLLSDHPEYLLCAECGTARLKKIDEVTSGQVIDEKTHLYGDGYWFENMFKKGNPVLNERAREDLVGRNQYWLKTLLKYRLPPLKTLEIGCAHGSFVKLLKHAGFHSSGLEMSPNVISQAKNWFDINVLQGPIELAPIELEKYDIILAFDVIEHLRYPLATMKILANYLRNGGLLVIQTPNLDLCKGQSWRMFLPPEHTFIFNEKSLRSLFEKLGFTHFAVEPACFEDDQFLFISKEKFIINSRDAIEKSLMATPNGRIALALSDLYENYQRERLQCIQKHGGGRKLLIELVKVFLRRLTSLTSRLFLK